MQSHLPKPLREQLGMIYMPLVTTPFPHNTDNPFLLVLQSNHQKILMEELPHEVDLQPKLL